ncbi:AfsA-related hotdog domain-containing protein [Cellulomonas sp. CW35]|uniref:AfsA-related hotdog domain-containing protein n=1 Tax=Cellulomonas sp. CW35 TaxID=3458249 RepID=UPI000AB65CFB
MQRSTFDQRYVHKLDPWAMLVTDVTGPGDDARLDPQTVWDVDVVLPLGIPHPVYAHQSAVLLALEGFRQAGTALAHVAGGVPLGFAFIASRVAMTWVVDPTAFVGDVPARFRFLTRSADHRRGTLVRHVFDAEVTIDGELVAHASGDLQCVDPRVHARLRGGAPAWQDVEHRHDPAALGDVRTTTDALEAWLGWEADDRMVFDHGVDHVPAMHLARAAMTAHHLLTAAENVTAIDVRCTRYVELDTVADVRAVRDGSTTRTEVLQGGTPAAVITCASGTLPADEPGEASSRTDEPVRDALV